MSFRWTETNAVLDGFFELLACGRCKKTPERPIKFVTCGHMFCDTCSTESASVCIKCKVQVRPNEIQPYHLAAQLISYCQSIKEAIQEMNSEDEECERATSDSQLNITKVAKHLVSMLNEDRRGDSESKTPGHRDDTQNFQIPDSNEADSDTPGYRDLTQINFLPKGMERHSEHLETPGFRGPTQLSETLREIDSQSETPGYRDPTQICCSVKEGDLREKVSKIVTADPKALQNRVVEAMEVEREDRPEKNQTLAPETLDVQSIFIRIVDAANTTIPESMETCEQYPNHDTVSVGSELQYLNSEHGKVDEDVPKRRQQTSSKESDRATENLRNPETFSTITAQVETMETETPATSDTAKAKIIAVETLTSVESVRISAKKQTQIKMSKKADEKNPATRVTDNIVQSKRRPGSSTAAPKSIPKNVNKRNAKGETILHTACVKGQVAYVKALLEVGANPNTKDNAGWTPLQEAVLLGNQEICRMLLESGASPNTPGMDNRTALHDAAISNNIDEASVILQFHGSREVYDKFGKRPIDYAVSDEMRALLSDRSIVDEFAIVEASHINTTLDHSILTPNAKVVVLPSNLSSENKKLLTQLASKLKVTVATTFRPGVTHVVVEANERNVTQLTLNVMLAILEGKWILNSQWISISRDLSDISEIDLEIFQVHGAPNPGTPERSRLNEEKQNPRLFNNCHFFFTIGVRASWKYGKLELTKQDLTNLVLAGRGETLNREPDPEVVKDCRLTPFHVAHKLLHPLHRCSYYIIYMPGKDEPRVKYNMPHIKTLPLAWFFECIEKFALIDPALMGIS